MGCATSWKFAFKAESVSLHRGLKLKFKKSVESVLVATYDAGNSSCYAGKEMNHVESRSTKSEIL